MNSKETLTCNLFQLPQDIFRVIFQYLSVKDLMKGEEAFRKNQELLSLYRSSLKGFTLKQIFKDQDQDIDDDVDDDEDIEVENDDEKEEELISWIIDRKLLVETLDLYQLRDFKMELLNQSRSSLKSIDFQYVYFDPDNSVPVIASLGHFPSLTSVTFSNFHYFTKDRLISFFSHNPQLEIVKIHGLHYLSNEILSHLSNYCPKIKILSLYRNDWVDDETMSLLTQQRLFPNLKSLNIQDTKVTNEESLRQFILSHPLLSGLILPTYIEYSKDFLIFYLRQLIFPSILSHNNDHNNDLESHSLAISCLWSCLVSGRILDGSDDIVNPEIFSVDILSHLYYKGMSSETLYESTEIFSYLSDFPSMIDSILQSQFIPFILNSPRPDNYRPTPFFVDLLCRCGVFHDYFTLLVEKFRTHPNTLLEICQQVVRDHFPLLTTEELQAMIPIVSNKLQNKDFAGSCLKIISKLLREPFSHLFVDPNDLLLLLKSLDFRSNYLIDEKIDCLNRFISVNENYQRAFIESNLLTQIMAMVPHYNFISFTKHCLLSSRYELLVDHLVNSGLVQRMLSIYSQWFLKNEIEPLFKLLIEFKNNKYSEIVREVELPDELRVKLFEKREGEEEERERV